MAYILHISIPCIFDNNVLTIGALRLTGMGETPEKALMECIKNTPYYTGLKSAKIAQYTNFRGRDFMHIETPFSNTVYDAICDIEPFPGEAKKKKQMKSFLAEPSAEDIIKYGH